MKTRSFNRQIRLQRANALIQTVATCGRKFFSHSSGRISFFEIAENGRLYYRDKYSAATLPCSHTKSKKWRRHFSEGGTLKSLIEALANHINTGEPVSQFFFGPWSQSTCNDDLWGYGEDMEIVRTHAKRLEIMISEVTHG